MRNRLNLVSSLVVCLILLVAVIFGGTLYAYICGTYKNVQLQQAPSPVEKDTMPVDDSDFTDFAGLGISRFVSADENPCTIVAAPYFRYNQADTAFTEELAKKTRLLNTRIGEWFIQYPKQELLHMDESFIKAELTAVINKELVLGKVEKLYFDEFLIIE